MIHFVIRLYRYIFRVSCKQNLGTKCVLMMKFTPSDTYRPDNLQACIYLVWKPSNNRLKRYILWRCSFNDTWSKRFWSYLHKKNVYDFFQRIRFVWKLHISKEYCICWGFCVDLQANFLRVSSVSLSRLGRKTQVHGINMVSEYPMENKMWNY